MIKPEYPWEMAELGGYDQVLKVGEGDYRFYYTCIGAIVAGGSATQRVCLARSTDGVTWHKPMLGIVSYRNSTQNNIMWPFDDAYNEPGTVRHSADPAPQPGSAQPPSKTSVGVCVQVFVDDNPACPASERFKMILSWSPKDAPAGQCETRHALHFTGCHLISD